jgi:adenylosuccinate lyase
MLLINKLPKLFSTFNSFNALSPLDGRYAQSLEKSVSNYFSEAALMKYRIKVEAEWLLHLIETNVIPKSTQISLE